MQTGQTKIYQPPYWSAKPSIEYIFEVLKNGVIIDTINISQKEYLLVGRGKQCDIILDHPSISRQHAYIQHRDNGMVYLYDLDSTHGTFWNKKRIAPHKYVPIRKGDLIKFGESTRSYILESEDPKAEEIAENQRRIQMKAMEEQKQQQKNIKKKPKKQEKKPQKQKDWDEFEEDEIDEETLAELAGDGPRRVRIEEEFVDTSMFDEYDEFFDRTLKHRKLNSGESSKVETRESLEAKRMQVNSKILQLQKQFQQKRQTIEAIKVDEESEDSLDAFMAQMKSDMSKQDELKMKEEMDRLLKERERLDKLIELVAPAMQDLRSSQEKAGEVQMDILTTDMFIREPKRKIQRKQPKKVQEIDLRPMKKDLPKKEEKKEEKIEESIEKKEEESIEEEESMEKEEEIPVIETKEQSTKIERKPLTEDQIRQMELIQQLQREGEDAPTIVIEEPKEEEEITHTTKEIKDWHEEHKIENWVAPKGQTGDGMTELNKKLGY